MKRLLIAALSAAVISSAADAAKISITPSGILTYTETTEQGDITITFRKCMANNLYTFYDVKLDGKTVNTAQYSDNIGPFSVSGYWMGGNHNNVTTGAPTANTVNVQYKVDEAIVKTPSVTIGKVLTIDVENELFYSDGKKFTSEFITYVVSGNSIEVYGEHYFEYPSPLTVSRYYGAQSMFVPNEILLPGSKNKTWQSSNVNEIDVYKSEAPDFSTFVERNSNAYQAVLKFSDGLGDAHCIADNSPVYLWRKYGSSGKSYHVMMWDHQVKSGDNTQWHALYTWFCEPVTDTFDGKSADPVFEYTACLEGETVTMKVGADGKTSQSAGIDDITVDRDEPFAFAGDGSITIGANAPAACCFDVAGKIIRRGAGTFSCRPGIYIVSDMKGHSVKLIVK